MAAKTAAQAAGSRFVLGLGVANPVMNARFGMAPFAPLPMIEGYLHSAKRSSIKAAREALSG